MKEITLTRWGYTPMGTFGTLVVDDFNCFTVERPWLNNKPNVSCIPEGEYKTKLGRYNACGYAAYEVLNVKDRTHIKIHKANNMYDVMGCIGLGKSLSYFATKNSPIPLWSITHSSDTFNSFMDVMNNDDGVITIKQHLYPSVLNPLPEV